jgi:hypothetical protein
VVDLLSRDELQDLVAVEDCKAHHSMNCQSMRKRTLTRSQINRTRAKLYTVRRFQKAEVPSREGVEDLEATAGVNVAWEALLESKVSFQERS